MERPDKNLYKAIEGSFNDLWISTRACVPGVVLRRESDMVLYSTGIPNSRFNGVLNARFTSKSMFDRTRDALRYFEEARLPMTWHVGPLSTPAELGIYLESQGMAQDDVVRGMSLNLGNVGRMQKPSGLDIHDVDNLESLNICLRLLFEAYGFEEDTRRTLRDVYVNLGMDSTHRWVLARLEGKPVATSLLIIHEGLAVIWIVGTIPDARGRGIGTAVTHEQLLSARDLGYDRAVLQSTEMGYPIYKKLGFEECCEIRAYTWSPRRVRC